MNKTDEQLDHIYKAREHLFKAGVDFESGGIGGDGDINYEEWELNCALKGAIVVENGRPNKQELPVKSQEEITVKIA